MNSSGAGSGKVEFQARAAEEVPGTRVTAKICELCTRMFFRDKEQKECKACEAKLAQLRESQPMLPMNPEINLRKQPKSELAKMHMRAAQAKRQAEARASAKARMADDEKPRSILDGLSRQPELKAQTQAMVTDRFFRKAAMQSETIQ